MMRKLIVKNIPKEITTDELNFLADLYRARVLKAPNGHQFEFQHPAHAAAFEKDAKDRTLEFVHDRRIVEPFDLLDVSEAKVKPDIKDAQETKEKPKIKPLHCVRNRLPKVPLMNFNSSLGVRCSKGAKNPRKSRFCVL